MANLKTVAGMAGLGLLAQGCVIIADGDDIEMRGFHGDHPRSMVVVDESDVIRDEAPPHGRIGMSTAYRISDEAPRRSMEFRKRTLHVGAAIGEHVIDHDEVYYVVSGTGRVMSDGDSAFLRPGMAAYLYEGAEVGIEQVGDEPLTIIISYPLNERR